MQQKQMKKLELLEFQKKTIEHIVNFFEKKNVYLLADETGLGKTVIASEVIQRLFEEKSKKNKKMNVLYIASNLDLAQKNVEEKLMFQDAEVIPGRLSMLWQDKKGKSSETEKPVKLFALTPEVSLKQSTQGTQKEREACCKKYEELGKGNELYEDEKMKKLQEKIEKIETCRTLLAEYDDSENGGEYGCLYYREKKKIGKFLFGGTKLEYQNMKFSYNIDSDFQLAILMIVDICLKNQVWNYMYYMNEENQKIELDEILQLDSIRNATGQAISKLDVNSELKEYVNILWGNGKGIVTENLISKPDEMVQAIANEININELVQEIKKNESITQKILRFLKEKIYDEQYEQCIRTYMSFYSLKEIVKPDVVIIDEIQNYPEIFQEDEITTNEQSQIIKMVIDSVLNGEQQSEKKQKILMLSATPYAYRNMIEVEEDDEAIDELDEFSKHLVGMDAILSYMKKRNGCEDNIFDMWKKCQDLMGSLREQLVYKQVFDEGIYEDIVKALKALSCVMKELGISRTERPIKDYWPSKEKYLLEDFNLLSIGGYYQKGKKACGNRLALSLPATNKSQWISGYKIFDASTKYVEFKTDEKEESQRVKALMKDLFDKEAYLYLFIPPNKPYQKLTGVFEGSERTYGKTVLFSAFNAVPPALKQAIEGELDERLASRINKTTDEFEKLLENLEADYKKYIEEDSEDRNTINGYCTDKSECELLCKIFTQKHAQKVLLSIYGEELLKDYWGCVDAYCRDGNFEAVMDEFLYMRNTLKKHPSLTEYLESSMQLGESTDFCVMSTSQTGGNLKENLKAFNAPFYPHMFLLTSVAEEGHDFHWYSDRIVHWNAPSTPIALMQREGRVDRCDCMAVRKVIAEKMELMNRSECTWEESIELYKKEYIKCISDVRFEDMFPRFVAEQKSNNIMRMCYYYPLSGEYFRWEILMKNLEYYRSMFGASENVKLTDAEWELLTVDEQRKISSLMLDLHVL